jgi:hypothetical protein
MPTLEHGNISYNNSINSGRILRILFILTVAYGGVIFWFAPALLVKNTPH